MNNFTHCPLSLARNSQFSCPVIFFWTTKEIQGFLTQYKNFCTYTGIYFVHKHKYGSQINLQLQEGYFNSAKTKALNSKRYISQLLRSSKDKTRHKMCSLQIHLGTQLLGILTSLFNLKLKDLPWMSVCGRSWQTWFWNMPHPWR